MSCRVLGRQVEPHDGFLNLIAALGAGPRRLKRLVGVYIPTA